MTRARALAPEIVPYLGTLGSLLREITRQVARREAAGVQPELAAVALRELAAMEALRRDLVAELTAERAGVALAVALDAKSRAAGGDRE